MSILRLVVSFLLSLFKTQPQSMFGNLALGQQLVMLRQAVKHSSRIISHQTTRRSRRGRRQPCSTSPCRTSLASTASTTSTITEVTSHPHAPLSRPVSTIDLPRNFLRFPMEPSHYFPFGKDDWCRTLLGAFSGVNRRLEFTRLNSMKRSVPGRIGVDIPSTVHAVTRVTTCGALWSSVHTLFRCSAPT